MTFLPPLPNPPSETIPATMACDAAINQAPLPPDFVPNPHIGAAYGCERPSPECGTFNFVFIFSVATGNGDVLRRDFLGCLPPEFICPAGFTLNGPICIRDRCPIDRLTPLPSQTEDPDTYAFEYLRRRVDISRLNSVMTKALDCLVDNSGQPYTAFVTSAWRPPRYQTHLQEVWDKWQILKENNEPECRDRKAEVRSQLVEHEMQDLKIRPSGANNSHSRGEAIDVRSTFIPTVDRLSNACEVYRPYRNKDKDKWHVEHR